MFPEYVGPIMTLDDDGNPEDPFTAEEFNIEDFTLHGSYNCGICTMPVLCMDPVTNDMIVLWSAMDENNVDSNGRYYFKLFARASEDGGNSWSEMVQLTTDPSHRNLEHVYTQAVILDGKLIVAAQVDNEAGSYAESDEDLVGDNNYYSGMVFDISEVFGSTWSIDENAGNSVMSIYPSPAIGVFNVTVAVDTEIVIYNMMGQSLLTIKAYAGNNIIDISSLSTGVYFVSDGISTKKLLVK